MTASTDRFHRRSFLGIAAIGVLGLTVAGCGDDDDPVATGGEEQAPGTTANAPVPTTDEPQEAVVDISMKDIEFQPKVATVKVGQRVVWTNREGVQHDVRALKGATFHSELFGEGGSFSFTPKKAGTISYDCSVHPGMTGKLKVVEA
ncbi:cupredoxin domain-containing protein [Patulibacter minatonensis]|uniref:cupredoxin domain-containing protein n=1 Tax=Patulibacter minatonensis TaxID=298163 RepID=UPI0004AF2DFB|nr:plastocyanin/azurin family copper-binding protein [Patulibacter minatonensis]